MKYQTFWRWTFPADKTVVATETRGLKVRLKAPEWARCESFFACRGDYGVWLIIDAVTGLKVNTGLYFDLSLRQARHSAEQRLKLKGRDSYYLKQAEGLRNFGSPDPDFAPIVKQFLAGVTP